MFALQPEMKVFSGTANRELAERICKYIGVPLGQATISSFPDGETYVMIEENVRGRDVFLIQPTSPPALDYAVQTCLEKDPDNRFQTAHDVKLQLAWITKSGSQTGVQAVIGNVRSPDRSS